MPWLRGPTRASTLQTLGSLILKTLNITQIFTFEFLNSTPTYKYIISTYGFFLFLEQEFTNMPFKPS